MYNTGWARSRRALDCFFILMAESLGGYWEILDCIVAVRKLFYLHHCSLLNGHGVIVLFKLFFLEWIGCRPTY